jgi:hypothetical protein
MRRALLLLLLPLLVTGCLGTQPYEHIDLVQVEEAYATIVPQYIRFQTEYEENHTSAWQQTFRQTRKTCAFIDAIDKRDTIDASTNLWVASSHLDSFCNDLDTARATWRKAHGLSYNKFLPISPPGTYFVDGDYNIIDFRKLMKHPAATWRPGTPFVLTTTPGPTPATPIAPTPTAGPLLTNTPQGN